MLNGLNIFNYQTDVPKFLRNLAKTKNFLIFYENDEIKDIQQRNI